YFLYFSTRCLKCRIDTVESIFTCDTHRPSTSRQHADTLQIQLRMRHTQRSSEHITLVDTQPSSYNCDTRRGRANTSLLSNTRPSPYSDSIQTGCDTRGRTHQRQIGRHTVNDHHSSVC